MTTQNSDTQNTVNESPVKGVGTSDLFAVIPGWIRSKNDGQDHFIGADQLMSLYRVPPAMCRIMKEGRPLDGKLYRLRPNYRGVYELPKAQQAAVNRWLSANNRNLTADESSK